MCSQDERLEKSISDFFSEAGACTTRRECDAFANKAFGGPIVPVSPQGVCSYTVVAANDTLIVQFREPDSPLDAELLEAARDAHPDFVAGISFSGEIGSHPALLIYAMNKLPGDSYFNISLSLPDDDLDFRVANVRSLARFFAQSWKNPRRPDSKIISAISQDCHTSFAILCSTLPTHSQEKAVRVQQSLPALFSTKYPLVLTHGDLSEMNILVEPKTGEITGIIDWAEAGVQPFGFALYALDNLLGYLTPTGWIFHSGAELLRNEFWRVFDDIVGGVSEIEMRLIRLARAAGLFLRYGVPYRPGRKGVVGIGGPGSSSLRILEALNPA